MLRSPYPSPSRRASSHEGERSSTHSTTESRSPRKSERPSSSVAAARGCAHGARGRITLPMSLGPCVISRRVRVGSADNLTIVVPIETFSRRARRRRRRDGGRALGRSELHHEGQLLSRVSRLAPRAHPAIPLADRGGGKRAAQHHGARAGSRPACGRSTGRRRRCTCTKGIAPPYRPPRRPRAPSLRRRDGFLPSWSASATVPDVGHRHAAPTRGLRFYRPEPSSFCHADGTEPTRR